MVYYHPGMTLTRKHLAHLAKKIRDGEEAKRERDDIIRKLRESDPEFFTQKVLAEMAEIAQQTVSFILGKKNGPTA